MFKGAKWRSDRNKIKAVFRLQFQATQVPQLGWDSLMVALVSSETGKTTAKTEKVQVRNGICQWENPVYETVKLIQEAKTGKLLGKICQVVVATGSSKGGFLGKTALDFAEFADAISPCSLSLPLGTSNSMILHVTIQRLNIDGDKRDDTKRDGTAGTPDRSSHTSRMSDFDTDGSSKASTCNTNSNASKDTAADGTIQLSPSMINTVPRTADCNGNLRGFRSSGAISASSSSGSSSVHDFSNEYKFKNNGHNHAINFLRPASNAKSPQLLASENRDMADHRESEDSNTEWSRSWIRHESRENSTYTSKEIDLNEKSQVALHTIEKLEGQIAAMTRQAEVSDLEVQTLRKQIVKENRKVQEFSREICNLKEERDVIKQEYEQLKGLKITNDIEITNKLYQDSNDSTCILEEIKQELTYERDLNANLRLQLQKTQEANSELILAVQDLEDMLEEKDKEITHVCISRCSMPVIDESCLELIKATDDLKEHQSQSYQCPKSTEYEQEKEQLALEVLITKHDSEDKASPFEQNILELKSQMEECKRDRNNLEMQMEQLALDYEILKQENHDMSFKLEQSQIQEQLKLQYESSVSLVIINDLETQVENLEKELSQQQEALEVELATLSHAKVEQEQRAIKAEELLRKTRQGNAETAERLQEEFRKLSMQMSVAFETNEKLAMQAMTESSDLYIQKSHLEELLRKSREELSTLQVVKDQYEEKLNELSTQLGSQTQKINQQLSEIECLTRELKSQRQAAEATKSALSAEVLSLKADAQMLTMEKNTLLQKVEENTNILVEMEKVKVRMNEKDFMLQREETQRTALQEQVLLAGEEAGKLLEELHDLRHQLVKKEEMIFILRPEMEKMTAEYNALKNALLEDEFEKEILRKQVFQLRNDLKKKGDTITTTEKKIKDNSSRVLASTGNAKASPRNSKSSSSQQRIKEIIKLQEKIKLLEEELKVKETILQSSRNEFIEKERDLNAKIEELHKSTAHLALSISNNTEGNIQENILGTDDKENSNRRKDISVRYAEDIVAHFQMQEPQHEDRKFSRKSQEKNEMIINKNVMLTKVETLAVMLDQATKEQDPSKSSVTNPRNGQEIFSQCTSDQDGIKKLTTEIEQLKMKNTSMEEELKEMQERYSDISLKFAEVEGERQQLIMTIRNLKNAKKA